VKFLETVLKFKIFLSPLSQSRNILYYVEHLSHHLSLYRMQYKCPQVLDNDTYGSCFWDIKTDPHYRQPYEYYYFTLTAKNVFGNWSKQIEFHHYSHGKLLVSCHTF
jgi:hypothetical protein